MLLCHSGDVSQKLSPVLCSTADLTEIKKKQKLEEERSRIRRFRLESRSTVVDRYHTLDISNVRRPRLLEIPLLQHTHIYFPTLNN